MDSRQSIYIYTKSNKKSRTNYGIKMLWRLITGIISLFLIIGIVMFIVGMSSCNNKEVQKQTFNDLSKATTGINTNQEVTPKMQETTQWKLSSYLVDNSMWWFKGMWNSGNSFGCKIEPYNRLLSIIISIILIAIMSLINLYKFMYSRW